MTDALSPDLPPIFRHRVGFSYAAGGTQFNDECSTQQPKVPEFAPVGEALLHTDLATMATEVAEHFRRHGRTVFARNDRLV
jgi:hypothetical protein